MIEKVTWIFDGKRKVRKDKIVFYQPGYEEWNMTDTMVLLDGIEEDIFINIPFDRMVEIMEEE